MNNATCLFINQCGLFLIAMVCSACDYFSGVAFLLLFPAAPSFLLTASLCSPVLVCFVLLLHAFVVFPAFKMVFHNLTYFTSVLLVSEFSEYL